MDLKMPSTIWHGVDDAFKYLFMVLAISALKQ